MKHLMFCFPAAFCLLISSQVSAAFITMGAFSTYTETTSMDVSGDLFTLANISELTSGVQISSVSFQLPAGTIFDTAPDGMGINPSSDFMIVTPLSGGNVTALTSDGSSLLTLQFEGFDPGKTFSFSIDVDSLTGSDIERRQVLASEFADTLFSITFTGPIVGSPLMFSKTFNSPLGPFMAISAVSEQAEPVETVGTLLTADEPNSWIMLLLGTAGLGIILWKRRADA